MSEHNPQYPSSITSDADTQHSQEGSAQTINPAMPDAGLSVRERRMTTSEVLRAARQKISDEECWVQGEYAVDSDGMRVGPTSYRAYAYCATGALCAITRRGGARIWLHPAYAALNDRAHMTSGNSLPDFNDAHSHSEILELFDRAIAAESKAVRS